MRADRCELVQGIRRQDGLVCGRVLFACGIKPSVQLHPAVSGGATVDIVVVSVVIVVVIGRYCSVCNGRPQHGGNVLDSWIQQQAIVVYTLCLDTVVYTLCLDVIQGTVDGGRGDHLISGVKHGVLVGLVSRVIVCFDTRRAGGRRRGYCVIMVSWDTIDAEVASVPGEGRQWFQLGQIIVLFRR